MYEEGTSMTTLQLPRRILWHYRRVNDALNGLDTAGEPWAKVLPGKQWLFGNVIVLPGSFNPPTTAHVALLRQARAFTREQGRGPWEVYAALTKQVIDK